MLHEHENPYSVPDLFGLNIFNSNQFIQYNTIVNHTNIRIRTEAEAYQVLLLIKFFSWFVCMVFHGKSVWHEQTIKMRLVKFVSWK